MRIKFGKSRIVLQVGDEVWGISNERVELFDDWRDHNCCKEADKCDYTADHDQDRIFASKSTPAKELHGRV